MSDPDQDIKNAIEIWKKTIDVQQHFNDLCLRVRNSAITVVGALLAAMSFTYQQGLETTVLGYKFGAGLGFVAAALFAWFAFFVMDYYWYHVFLKGAVQHAGKIEEAYNDKIPGIGLGGTISEESQSVRMFGIIKTNSQWRLMIFYGLGFLMLALIFVALLFAQKQAAGTPAAVTTTQADAPTPLPATPSSPSNKQPAPATAATRAPQSSVPSPPPAPQPLPVQKAPVAQ
jgi:hypothetical protein